jgi:hypothetical protein
VNHSDDDAPELELMESDWLSLRLHLARGGLIVVSPELDLLDVARKIVNDDSAQVGVWVEIGLVSRPSPEQVELWDKQPSTRFRFVIAQPYVMMQASAQ